MATIKNAGRHADGGGLYLVVDKSGAKRWAFLYRREKKLKEMGLGGLNSVSLARARELAGEARSIIAEGGDPINARRAIVQTSLTFGQASDELIEAIGPGFRNAKHLAQWKMTLTHYAASLRDKPIDGITTDDVLEVLRPIWSTKPETASRVRGRIERVLDAAKARGLRTGENPALWRGHLANLLPKRNKLSRGHHAAMDYREVPAFVALLRQREAVSARALEFTILTAARSGETYGAIWPEINLRSAVWTIPAARMKAGREHRVPLSDQAVAILKEMQKAKQSDTGFVFPGAKRDEPLSAMAMEMILRRMKIDVTVHGFRSSFRDWCGEATSYPREVAESRFSACRW